MEIQPTQAVTSSLTFPQVFNGSITPAAALTVEASPWRTPERSLANENLHQFWSELSLEQPVLPFFGRFLQGAGVPGAGGTHAEGEGDHRPAPVTEGNTGDTSGPARPPALTTAVGEGDMQTPPVLAGNSGDASLGSAPRSFSMAKHETDRDEPAVVAQPVVAPGGVWPRSASQAKHETDRDEPAVVAQPVVASGGVWPRSASQAKHETDRDEAPVQGQLGQAGNQAAFFNRFLKA